MVFLVGRQIHIDLGIVGNIHLQINLNALILCRLLPRTVKMVWQDAIDFTETHEFDKFIDFASTAQWVILKIIDKICSLQSRNITSDIEI